MHWEIDCIQRLCEWESLHEFEDREDNHCVGSGFPNKEGKRYSNGVENDDGGLI